MALGTHWKKLKYTQHQRSHTHLNIAAAARPWAQWNCEQSGSCPHAGSRSAPHGGTRQTGSAPGTDGSWNISGKWNAQCGPDTCREIQSTRGSNPPHLLLIWHPNVLLGRQRTQANWLREGQILSRKTNTCPPTLSSLSSYIHPQPMGDALPKFRDQTKYTVKISTPLVQHLLMSQIARNQKEL